MRRLGVVSLCLVGLLLVLTAAAPRSDDRLPSSRPLERLIRHRLSALDARVGLHALHVPTGRQVAVNADEPMNTASVIKIPIMILAYRDAEAGLLHLAERYEVTLTNRPVR